MASNGDEQKVRPIEFEPDDTSPFATNLQQHNETSRGSRRPLLAVAFSAVAVLMAVGAVSVFGALEFSDAQPWTSEEFSSAASSDPDSASNALPPRLEDSLPYVTDRLTLVAIADDRLQTLLWDPSYRLPRSYDLPIESIGEATQVDASFDSGGRMLAISVKTPSGSRVYLGEPTDIGKERDLVGATSIIWHASDVGAISWTIPGSEGGAELHAGKVNPLSGSITDDVTVAQFDESVELVHWDSSGFVLNQHSSVTALNSVGRKLWTRPGAAVSASASILTVITTDHRGNDTRWLVIDRQSGEPSLETVDGPPNDISVVTSHNTDLIAEVSASDERTSILVHGPGLDHRRIVTFNAPAIPIGFSASSEYLQLSALDSNDIIFVDWRGGITHTVAVPEEFQVIGIGL